MRKSLLTNMRSATVVTGVRKEAIDRRACPLITLTLFPLEPESELENKAKLLGVTVNDMRMVMSAP